MTVMSIVPFKLPRNFCKTAPVYPIIAEISNFKIIRMRAKSIGLKNVSVIVSFSKGYSLKTKSNIRNMPSYIIPKNNQVNMATPNPFVLSSYLIAIKNARREKTIDNTTDIASNVKNVDKAEEVKTPKNNIGIVTPRTRLNDSDMANPKYTPAKTDFLESGCVNNSSINSLEL